jgi:radical SAM protein with 4Fe4S-binding SPASM domain
MPRVGELTTDEALKICDQFPDLLVREVDFTGGEPLLRSDWPVIAARIIELGIAANILTNGLILDSLMISRMKEVGISGVGISLDGLEATHDYTRDRKGSFASVMQSIALMRKADLPFNVITTVNALNLPELPDMLDLLLSAGVRFWRLQAIIPMGRVRDHSELQIDSNGILRLGRFIQDQRARLDKHVMNIICSDGLEYVVDDDPDEKPWRGCSAGIVACGITSDGRVKGCLSMPDELTEGDLRKDDLWDIWFNPESFAYTRQFSTGKLGSNCEGCEKGEDCKGGCSSSSYCATGRFNNDAYCFYKVNKVALSSAAVQ